MIAFPNAKINLGLRVTRKRPDGYHDIASLMIPVGWQDVLEAVPSAENNDHTLVVTGHGVDCPTEKNLVMRAIRAVEDYLGHRLPPSEIFLRKIIPDGAGMGGGSADAAAMIILINNLYSLDLTPEVMASIAAGIGADCPFFIHNLTAVASGTGTTLTPAPDVAEALRALSLDIIIAKPGEGISTREAYAGIRPEPASGPSASEIVCTLPPEEWAAAGLRNDFEASVIPRCPSIGRAKEAMLSHGAAFASMTGSGSAVFGLFRRGCDIMSVIADERLAGCVTFSSPFIPE